MSDPIDSKIKELFDIVQARRAELVEDEKTSKHKWLTTCSYPMLGQFINIQTANAEQIRLIVMHIKQNQFFGRQADEELGFTYTGEIAGYQGETWIEDCKKRLSAIMSRDKKKELDELEARLDKIISPEQRREMELASIMDSLK